MHISSFPVSGWVNVVQSLCVGGGGGGVVVFCNCIVKCIVSSSLIDLRFLIIILVSSNISYQHMACMTDYMANEIIMNNYMFYILIHGTEHTTITIAT